MDRIEARDSSVRYDIKDREICHIRKGRPPKESVYPKLVSGTMQKMQRTVTFVERYQDMLCTAMNIPPCGRYSWRFTF